MSAHRSHPAEASYSSEEPPLTKPSGPPREPVPASSSPSFDRRILWICRGAALALGALQAWAYRYEANPDGVSYLDVADAYREGRWDAAPNGYWSPAYSWVLAVLGAVLRTSPSADFVVSHGANFLAYVAALVAFEYLLRGVIAVSTAQVSGPKNVPENVRRDWIILGYGLFVWSTLGLIGLGVNTPDMLLAAAAFGVAGILTRIALPGRAWVRGALLGIAGGLAYLSKAAFLPLFFSVVLPVAAILWWRSRRTIVPSIVAVAAFAIVSAPYVVALSRAKGRFSFGESGPIAYAWIVNNVPGQVHWQGGPPRAGVPAHPTRQISAKPDAFEFATPLDATYPPWYDPSYWYDGVKAHMDPVAQLRIASHHIPLLVELLAPLLLVVVASGVAVRAQRRWAWRDLGRGWPLIVLGSAAVAMYATIFLQTRYVAPFVVMVWFGALLVLDPFVASSWRRGLFFAATIVLMLGTLPNLTPSVRALSPTYRNHHWDTATFVLGSGVRSGDRIAVVGNGVFAYWARLARLRIVAEVPAWATGDFWAATPEARRTILEAFRRAGAVAVVADDAPSGADAEHWRRQANGRLSVLPLVSGRSE